MVTKISGKPMNNQSPTIIFVLIASKKRKFINIQQNNDIEINITNEMSKVRSL